MDAPRRGCVAAGRPASHRIRRIPLRICPHADAAAPPHPPGDCTLLRRSPRHRASANLRPGTRGRPAGRPRPPQRQHPAVAGRHFRSPATGLRDCALCARARHPGGIGHARASLSAVSRATQGVGYPTSASPSVHPMYQLDALAQNTSPPYGAYTPAQIQQAYGFNKISFGAVRGDGTGQTIAIVDAYDDPNIAGRPARLRSPSSACPTRRHAGQPDRRDDLSGGRSDGRLGARGVARRRVGPRHGAGGEHPAGRGQFRPMTPTCSPPSTTRRRMPTWSSMSWGGGEFSGET